MIRGHSFDAGTGETTIIESAPTPEQLAAELDAAKPEGVQALRQKTQQYIFNYMPEWRQLRWSRYVEYYERLSAGGMLNTHEQLTMQTMIEPGETAVMVYDYCVAAIIWINECIIAHGNAEYRISQAQTTEEIRSIIESIAYPAWVR